MANKDRNKKTSEEIKEAILKNINECPQTAQDIALGINSNWKTVKEYLKECIKKAEKGIEYFYDHPRYIHILKTRVEKKTTSADILRRWYKKLENEPVEEKIAKIVNKIWKHTQKNKPIL